MNEQKTILLVDDSKNDLFLLRAAFKKAEFVNPLQEVYNGVQAIAYLSGQAEYNDRRKFPLPSVILLDLNMPMKGGFDVLKWARAEPSLKGLPIIVFTASTRSEDVKQAFELGATSFLVKPGQLDELVGMIRCLRDWLRINHFPPLNDAVRR